MNLDKIYAESVANEYSQKEDSKVKQLKRLDKKAKRPTLIFTYSFGILGTLIFGVGFIITIGILLEQTPLYMIIGSIIGVVGIIMMSINYLIYKKLKEKAKLKYGNDIILLAKQIVDENE